MTAAAWPKRSSDRFSWCRGIIQSDPHGWASGLVSSARGGGGPLELGSGNVGLYPVGFCWGYEPSWRLRPVRWRTLEGGE